MAAAKLYTTAFVYDKVQWTIVIRISAYFSVISDLSEAAFNPSIAPYTTGEHVSRNLRIIHQHSKKPTTLVGEKLVYGAIQN